MDFAALPPEINSASMYAGPGAGPMLAAAATWDGLAEDLYSTAASYQSVISGLTGGPWLGAASAAMAAAATPNVLWMTTVAGQAEQTAVQARMAVTAYETAFAMTVPPPVIAANRSTLMALIATNVLGQNTPAIAVTEALYDAMWAQDATAMYSYAANSASAATLPTFAVPQHTTNPVGLVYQAAAVGHATGTPAATSAQTALAELTATTPQTLQTLAAPTSTVTTSGLDSLTTLQPVMSATSSLGWITSAGLSNANQLKNLFPAASTAAAAALPAAAGGLAPATGAAGSTSLAGLGSGGTQAAASAAVGRAGTIGPLSVPQTWATGAAPISPAGSLTAPTPSVSSPVGPAAPASMLGPVPLAAGAGRTDPSPASATPRFDTRPSVVPRSPAAG